MNTVSKSHFEKVSFEKSELKIQGFSVNLMVYAVCHSFSIFFSYNQKLTSIGWSGVTSWSPRSEICFQREVPHYHRLNGSYRILTKVAQLEVFFSSDYES